MCFFFTKSVQKESFCMSLWAVGPLINCQQYYHPLSDVCHTITPPSPFFYLFLLAYLVSVSSFPYFLLHLALCLLLACPAKLRWPMANVVTDYTMASGILSLFQYFSKLQIVSFPYTPLAVYLYMRFHHPFCISKVTSHSMGLYAWQVSFMNSN
jgi:hypothetical protein